MNELMTPHGEAMNQIKKILGLPKYAFSFQLEVRDGHLSEVSCTYYPEDSRFSELVSQRFTLVPIDAPLYEKTA